MNSHSEFDLLVVGQGLAGSAVAMQAALQGLHYAIADPAPLPGFSASRVAAGLITPLTGKKINPGWRMEEWLPIAADFYARAGAMLGVRCFHPIEIHRWFTGEEEYRSFQARLEEERILRWFGGLLPPRPGLAVPQGGFRMVGGGWLDVPVWLDAIRARAMAEGRWFSRAVAEEDLRCEEKWIRVGDLAARRVIFCHGLAVASHQKWFPGLPFRPAAGEVLEVRLRGECPAAVWNQGGKWVAPRPDGSCLVGATYAFGAAGGGPTTGGRAELEGFLRALGCPADAVLGHRAGRRPILHQSRPVAGFSPVDSRVGLLNGLGSKGVLTAPWAAGQIVSHLMEGIPMDPELDPARLPGLHRRP